MGSPGSSPLARGLRGAWLSASSLRRIIPARAGFTPTRMTSSSPPWDHPRSRGVYLPMSPCRDGGGGSSPLARGLRSSATPSRLGPRIIPARAGFTPGTRRRTGPRPDHPRSRGVYAAVGSRPRAAPGSSPLARGLRKIESHGFILVRIIPARAGFTWSSATLPAQARDHPRSRGVYNAAFQDACQRSGSSPLARGLQRGDLQRRQIAGIIPARAGFTLSLPETWPRRRDHPRSRGVYTCGSLESQR